MTEPLTQDNRTSPFVRKPSKRLVVVALAFIVVLVLGLVVFTNKKHHALAYSGGQVSVNSSSFFPKTIEIKVGEQVTWTNTDSAPHWIASDPFPKNDGYKALNSGGALTHGDSYSISFTKAGTYTYHDNLNPFKLQGTVVVR